MRKIAFTFLTVFAFKAYCQNPYNDAIKLRSYITTDAAGKSKFIIPISGDSNEALQKAKMKEYCDLINNNYYNGALGTGRQIHIALSSTPRQEFNPFLADFLTPSGVLIADPVSLTRGAASSILSKIGNLDVTTIVDGFAKFIVERKKKELQTAFFDRFIEQIQKPEYEDARMLFPATYSVVKQLPKDVYNYQKYLQSLRDAFGKDMETILPHLEDVLRNGHFKDFFNAHLELKSVCLTAFYYGKGLQKGTHMGELIEKYNAGSQDYKLSSANADTVKTNAIRFIQEVSKSLKTLAVQDNEYWVPGDSIMMMINEEVTFKIYLGLLYQRVNGIKVCNTDPITYAGVMANMNDNINKLKSMIETISDQINNAQTQLRDFQEKVKKDRTLDDYIAYFNGATRVIESFKENELIRNMTSLLPAASQADINFYWAKYTDIVEATNAVLSIYTSIKEKSYSVAISNARRLYEMRFDPGIVPTAVKTQVQKLIEFLLEKGAFIASVAEAKTSDQVYEAINMVAMPAGSARVKRLSAFNVALNAYCGLFIGHESIRGIQKQNAINSYGLTVPIGITISKGHSAFFFNTGGWKKGKFGWSTSLFISLVDIGAVAAFRFNDDTTSQVPNIQLKNIFSPGAFISIGIPKSPISVNLGAQVGPNLRKVNMNNATLASDDNNNKTYARFSLSVVVDIPILNFSTKSK